MFLEFMIDLMYSKKERKISRKVKNKQQ